MKRFKGSFILITAILCLGLLGCASFTATREGSIVYPPAIPSEVKVFYGEPSLAYIKIGEVKGEGETISNRDNMLERLKEKAASLGADAIIVKQKEIAKGPLKAGVDVRSTYTYNFNQMYAPVMQATAIKFKKKG